jgi:hypothetical protein
MATTPETAKKSAQQATLEAVAEMLRISKRLEQIEARLRALEKAK